MADGLAFLVVPRRLIAAVILVVTIPVVVVACRVLRRRDVLDRFQANVFNAAAVVVVALGLIVLATVDQLGYPPRFD